MELDLRRELLVSEWSPRNQFGFPQCKVSYRAWWRCSAGHEWESRLAERLRGRGCPYCAGRKPTPVNNLLCAFPLVASQWHPTKNKLFPSDVLPKSMKKVWWVCGRNHEWEASINNRTRGAGCPYCAGQRATAKNNLSLFPDIVKQIHPTKNGSVNADRICYGSSKKMWWKCDNGHEWFASVNDRTRGRGCPHCSRKFSSLEVRICSEISTVEEAIWSYSLDGVEIDVFLPRLKLGIEVDGSYWHRDSIQKDAKKNKFLNEKGIRLIRTRESPLCFISEFDIGHRVGEEQQRVVLRLVRRIKSLCPDFDSSRFDGISFENDDDFRRRMKKLSFPKKSAMETNPELSTEWHPLKNGCLFLENFSYRSNKRVWWVCKFGHEWESVVAERTRGKGKCPACRMAKLQGKKPPGRPKKSAAEKEE